MSANPLDVRLTRTSWRWWVCGLLLLATMINYMDRVTLNVLAGEIKDDLGLTRTQYGDIEAAFAIAFALGALAFGLLVDYFNVFWIYPLAVFAWSAAGFATGLSETFTGLLICRFLLGLAESAHWPCALRTTRRVLTPEERTMGNSLLQSGAALGAILTPAVVLFPFDIAGVTKWRFPFFVVGSFGGLWILVWFLVMRPRQLDLREAETPSRREESEPALPVGLVVRRLLALVVLVITINMTWHFLRAWLPLFLGEVHGFSKSEISWFSMGYYGMADIGSLAAGFLTLRLAWTRLGTHNSRRLVYLGGALLCPLCIAAVFLPTGVGLVALLLVTGFASLAVFPNYYSFTQDLPARYQGRLTGALGFCCWVAMYFWQGAIGRIVDATESYTICFVIAGLAPLVGFLALQLLWGRVETPREVPWPGREAVAGAAADDRVTPADGSVTAAS